MSARVSYGFNLALFSIRKKFSNGSVAPGAIRSYATSANRLAWFHLSKDRVDKAVHVWGSAAVRIGEASPTPAPEVFGLLRSVARATAFSLPAEPSLRQLVESAEAHVRAYEAHPNRSSAAAATLAYDAAYLFQSAAHLSSLVDDPGDARDKFMRASQALGGLDPGRALSLARRSGECLAAQRASIRPTTEQARSRLSDLLKLEAELEAHKGSLNRSLGEQLDDSPTPREEVRPWFASAARQFESAIALYRSYLQVVRGAEVAEVFDRIFDARAEAASAHVRAGNLEGAAGHLQVYGSLGDEKRQLSDSTRTKLEAARAALLAARSGLSAPLSPREASAPSEDPSARSP